MSDTLFELGDFEPAPVYSGRAPLAFTAKYFHPDELGEAHHWLTRVQGMQFGSAVGRVHTWDYGITTGWVIPEGEIDHSLCLMTTSVSCFDYPLHDIDRSGEWYPGKNHRTCSCVQGYLYQAICAECEWNFIWDSETRVVEAWHDHAFPGWRDLPVIPLDIRPMGGGLGPKFSTNDKGVKRARAWVEENYPAEWQRPFAPVLTERRHHGTRHVPSYSPWGGFDLCGRVAELDE